MGINNPLPSSMACKQTLPPTHLAAGVSISQMKSRAPQRLTYCFKRSARSAAKFLPRSSIPVKLSVPIR
jgi:hypothetical protein